MTFFGGETLLNLDTIRAAVSHAEEQGRVHRKRVHFALTTNATLLSDEIIEFLIAHRFGVTISIDGDQQEQDRHRRFEAGEGSFDVIEPRVRELARREPGASRPAGGRARHADARRGRRARDLPLSHPRPRLRAGSASRR